MMASEIVYNRELVLVSGLDWRVLAQGKSVNAALRETGGEIGAQYANVCVSKRDSIQDPDAKGRMKKRKPTTLNVAGFYSDSSGEDKKPSKKTHSLASAFAQWSMASRFTSAVLCIAVQAGSDTRYAVCVHEDGIPVVDELKKTIEEAISLCDNYSQHPVFSDNDTVFPNTDTPAEMQDSAILLASIAAKCSKATQIVAIPANYVMYASLVALAVVAVVGYSQWQSVEKAKAKKALLLKAAQEDPAPKYANGLAMSRLAVGVDSDALKQALAKSSMLPVYIGGWQTKRIECSAAIAACTLQMIRKTGTSNSLVDKAKSLGLTVMNSSSLSLDEATLTWAQPFPTDKLGDVPSFKSFMQGDPGSILQTWKTAGLAVQLQPHALWPVVPDVPANFKSDIALISGAIEVNAIAIPQLREVLNSPASNVIWSGWVIDLDPTGPDVLTHAKARVFGAYYAKQ